MDGEPGTLAGVAVPELTASRSRPVKLRTGPDGVHLFDRRTGWNVLFDEACVPASAWSRAPRQVSIALTNACDLACAYCYAPKHPAVLGVDRLLIWARELDVYGCLGVGFGGGEPTLYRRLPQLCAGIAASTSLAVTLTTHGHRWTPRLVDELSGSVNFVRVSVDGVGSVYATQRGRSFDDLLDRLELISGAFPVGINCVVNAATLPQLDAVAALAASVGAAELLLLLEQPTDTRAGADVEVGVGMREWMAAHHGQVRLATGEQDAGQLLTAQPLPNETGLRAYAHIDATGRLRATSYNNHSVPIDDRGVLAACLDLQGAA
jgi:hypothetical protein